MERLQTLPLTVHHTQMGAIKFVGRAGKKVAVKVFHVDQPMRGILHRVNVNYRPRILRHFGQRFDVIYPTRQITGVVQRHQPGSLSEQRREQLGFHSPAIAIKFEPLHHQIVVFGHLQPGRHITLVFHSGNDDLVAGRKLMPETARQLVSQGRHVGANQHFPRIRCAEEVGHRLNGLIIKRVHRNRSRVEHTRVAIESMKKIDNPIYGVARHLRTCCVIQVDTSESLVGRRQRRKLFTYRIDRESRASCHIRFTERPVGRNATAHA